MRYEVTEVCPYCEAEVTMQWNVQQNGYKAFCPHCGNRLMLCDECLHRDGGGGCDYDQKADTCMFNQREELLTVDEIEMEDVVYVVTRKGNAGYRLVLHSCNSPYVKTEITNESGARMLAAEMMRHGTKFYKCGNYQHEEE